MSRCESLRDTAESQPDATCCAIGGAAGHLLPYPVPPYLSPSCFISATSGRSVERTPGAESQSLGGHASPRFLGLVLLDEGVAAG
jgi:hypothetical protein